MRRKRPGLSLGSVLTLALTAAVLAAGALLFFRAEGSPGETVMRAQRVAGLLGDALRGNTPAPPPASTARTVTVTLPPRATASPAASPAPTAPPDAERRRFSLTAGGVIAFESDISDAVYNKADKTFAYAPILAGVAQDVTGDLRLAVLGQNLNTADHKYSDLIVPEQALSSVQAAGFDTLLLHTNHALDQGVDGARETARAIAARGLRCGGVNTEYGSQTLLLDCNGVRVALLTYTDGLTAKGQNALESAAGKAALTLFSDVAASRDIAAARAQGAQCVIVCMHWGRTDAAEITAAQRETAKTLAALGADVILGTRPTRVLPLEWVDAMGENGQKRRVPVAYSLGTLLTESREGVDISGALLHLSIVCQGGSVAVEQVTYTPTYIWRQAAGGKQQYRVINSAKAAPAGMTQKQIEVMGRALARVQKALPGIALQEN